MTNNEERVMDKTCFVITPVGDASTDEFQGVIDAVIKPVLNELGFVTVAAHEKRNSGSITKGIITGIYEAELIIANITGGNPNVMYEVAFAHSLRKPVIHIIR